MKGERETKGRGEVESLSLKESVPRTSNHDDATSATTGVKQKGTKRKDTNLDPLLGLALEQPIETPLGVVRGRAAEVELGREPPVLQGEVSIRVLIRS
jgi:hypothetical protein